MVQAIWYGNPAAGNGAANLMKNLIWVDGGADATGANGSFALPFKTIQAAIDSIPAPVTAADTNKEWTVVISPTDYDEDLIYSKAIRLSLVGLGPWRLGDYSVTLKNLGAAPVNSYNVAPRTVRNIVWTVDAASLPAGGAVPQLNIMALEASSIPVAGTPSIIRISGSITIKGTVASQVQPWYGSLQVDAAGVLTLAAVVGVFSVGDVVTQAGGVLGFVTAVSGSTITVYQGSPPDNGKGTFTLAAITDTTSGATATVTAITSGAGGPFPVTIHNMGVSLNYLGVTAAQMLDYHWMCRFKSIRGPQTGAGFPVYQIAAAFITRYDGLFSPTFPVLMTDCAFNDDITTARAMPVAGVGANRPVGIKDSFFGGAAQTNSGHATIVTSVAGAIALDGFSRSYFTRNACTLVGGATLVMLEDETLTLAVVGATILTAGQSGLTVLGDPTAGTFAVTLPTLTAGATDNLSFTIKNSGTANAVSVTPGAGQTIDGVAGVFALTFAPGAFATPTAIKLVAKGTNWSIVAIA